MAPPVGGYYAWWDAQAITGTADNTAVTTWADLSGNSHDLNTHLGTPTYYKTTSAKLINGQPAIYFNGNGWLATGTFSVAQPWTVFVVARLDSTATRALFGITSDNVYFYSSGASVWNFYAGANLADGSSNTNVHVYTVQGNGLSSLVRIDGTQVASGNGGSTGLSTAFTVGDEKNAGTATSPLLGPIGEIIVYPSALSGANMASVESYLTGRWTTVTVTASTASVALGPLAVAAGTTAATGCARTAWLTLGSQTLALEDRTRGWFCSSLDLGYPSVREVVNSRPDRDGVTDRTQFFGSRVISANLTTVAGPASSIDQVAAQFAPFMLPAARPVLHYVLDRPGHPERTITLRGSGYSWPVAGGYQRDIQLQWVAADPVAYDPALKTATATPSTPGTITTTGDLPVRPVFRITGPITGPTLTLTPNSGPAWVLDFLNTFTVAAGHYVDIDSDARTVLADSDPAQPRLSSVDWTQSSWQWITPGLPVTMSLTGTSTTGATGVTATWHDAFLT